MIKTIALFLFIVGVFVFGMSYHSIDLAFNAKNNMLSDINGFAYVQNIPAMYLYGMSGLIISMIMMIGSFTMLFHIKNR